MIKLKHQKIYSYTAIGLSFLTLSFITVKFLAPDLGSNATTQNASETVGPYTLSMSNDSVASIDITPTASQQIFTTTNNLTLSNSCSAGATISISTNSETSNDLTRNGSDYATKEIPATTGSSLLDNTWGFSTDGGTTYNPVPMKGGTATYVYDAVEAATNKNIPVQFGIKTDSNLPSGTYTTDVVYTAAVKSGCLTYPVTWDMNGGTKKSGATYPTAMNWGSTIDLSQITPTRTGYTFSGWTSGSTTYTGSETSANLNPGNNNSTITMTAQWQFTCASGVASETINLAVNASKTLSYTGAPKCLLFAKDGNYKFELWGGSGGQYESTAYGGRAGYVAGIMAFSTKDGLYVYIGGQGASSSVSNTGTLTKKAGGWNGGGISANQAACCSNRYWGSGGGASDIRTVYGTWNDAISLRSRIMVASGGGGSYRGGTSAAENAVGGHGGGLTGYSGKDNYSTANGLTANSYPGGSGGSQISGGIATRYDGTTYSQGGFGYGGSLGNANAGGGSGWYGGGGSEHVSSAGGGSSYISGHTGSVAVTSTSSSSPKTGCTTGTTTNSCSISPYGYSFTSTVMIDGAGYKWTTTKGSLQTMPKPTSGNYGSGVGHTGNGYARITYLGI